VGDEKEKTSELMDMGGGGSAAGQLCHPCLLAQGDCSADDSTARRGVGGAGDYAAGRGGMERDARLGHSDVHACAHEENA